MSSFDEYRKKLQGKYGKNDKSSEKETEENTPTKVTTTGGSSFDDFRTKMLSKYKTDKVTAADIDTWFSDVRTSLTDMDDYYKQNEGKYNKNYGGDTATRINELLTSSGDIYSYLQNHKSEIGNFKELNESFSQHRSALEQYDYNNYQMSQYYSQWNSEEEYNAYNEWYEANKDKIAKEQEIMSAEDFEEYAKRGTELGDKWEIDLFGGSGYKNDIVAWRTKVQPNYVNPNMSETMSWNFANAMTEDEVNIYSYYLGKYGKSKADEYLDSIEERVNRRVAGDIYERIDGNAFLEYSFGVVAGLDQFASGVGNLDNLIMGTEADATSAIQMASGMVREDILENSTIKIGDYSLGTAAYDAVTSTSNMLPSILVGFIPGVGQAASLATLGASAVGSGYAEMRRLGYSANQARAYGVMVGVSEAALQYAIGGISALGGKASGHIIANAISKVDNAIARTAIKIGGNMLSEGIEESVQSVLEPIFNSIVTGEEVDIDWGEVAYSGLLGALTAGILEGGTTIAGEVSTYKAGKNIQQDASAMERLTKLGSTMSADSVAYRLAGKIDENTGAYTIGRLLNEVGASLSEKNMSDITLSLERKGVQTKDAQTIAKWLNKAVEGKYFTKKQRDILETNDVVSKTFADVIVNQNSTVWQRINGYNELQETAYSKASPTKASAQQTKGISATKNPTTKEIATEGKIQASEDVKTKLGDKEVAVKEIATIKDGDVTLRLEDDSTVKASDLTFGSNDALLYENVVDMGLNAATANAFIKGYNPSEGLSVDEYILGFREAYRYGEYGFPVNEMSQDGFSASLSQVQKELAYGLGKTDAKYKIEAKQKEVTEKASATSSITEQVRKGKVHYEGGVLEKNLTSRQKASLKGLETLAEALGIDFHVFESKVDNKGNRYYTMPDGTKTSANGWYDPKDKSIHIDLYAGQNGEGTMLFTAAHELTHFIREWSPAKFKVFADFLLEQYGEKGISVDELVNKQIEKAKRNRRDISYDTAYEEVVADSCESFLADGDAIAKIADLKAKDKTLWQKIKDFLTDLVAKIKAAYEGLSPDSVEGQYVSEMLNSAEKLKALWTEALVDASEAHTSATSINSEADGEVRLDDRDSHYDVEAEINESMTMEQAKQMIQRAFVMGGIKEWYDGEYKNGDEWARAQGADEVAMYVENEYQLQELYINKIPGILEDRFYISDVIEAYLGGTLTGKVKKKAQKLNLTNSVKVADLRFYAPQAIADAKALYEVANQRVNEKNRSEVNEARAKILLYAHNKGAAETLGITQSDLNKKLRSWSNYSSKARDASIKINAGIEESNRWTGIENMSYISKASVSADEVARMVKAIEGKSDNFQNSYIARTMLSLDTHIDWSWLTFKFDTKQGVNESMVGGSGRANGYYRDSERLIHAISNSPNTIAHEMGHALDHQWARDLGFSHSSLTEAYRNTEKVSGDVKIWFDQFKNFADDLAESASLYSAYTMDTQEVFARFVAKFVEWTEAIATGRSSGYETSYYNDKFTTAQFVEFARILQGKAALDANGLTANKIGDAKKGTQSEGNGGKSSEKTNYSLEETITGRLVAVVDDDILSGIYTGAWDKATSEKAKKAAKTALLKFKGGIAVKGVTAKVNRVSRREYTRSNYSEALRNHDPNAYADKLRAASVADDVVIAATNWQRDGKLTKPRKDDFVDFDRGQTLIMSGTNKYSATVIVGITAQGEYVFYDVEDMNPTQFDIKKERDLPTVTPNESFDDILKVSNGGIISQDFASVKSDSENILYSDRDSEAELSRLREEYSKALGVEKDAKKKLDVMEKFPRYDEMLSIISDKQSPKETIDEILSEYSKWQEESGYKAAYEEHSALERKARDLRREVDLMEERLSKSLREKKYSEDEVKAFVQKAVRKYRTTSSLNRASYLLTTGSMLDFSEGQGYRVKDHREISEILNLPDYAQYSDGMISFMNMGNIRLQTYGIDISALPNDKQISSLRGIIATVMRENDEFTVDFSKPNGNTDGSVTYPKGVASSKIISDIKNYFETGNVPEYEDSLSQFLYSDRDSYAPTFYSHMGKVVDGIKSEKVGAGGVVPYLKGKGVKNEEIKWSGIETFLEGKKSVTKAELKEFIAGSQLVIEEEMSNPETFEVISDGGNYIVKDKTTGYVLATWKPSKNFGQDCWMDEDGNIAYNEADIAIQSEMEYGESSTRWSQYKLEGGTNYRELVFKMPDSSYSNRAMRGHWGQDAEGVLVHARIQDFIVNGKKMLFIEELQSDWHNEGHEKGYTTKEYEDAVAVYDKLADDYAKKRRAFNQYVRSSEFRSDPDEVSKKKFDWLRGKMDTAEKRMHDAERDIEALKKKGMGDVADAPFRDTYHEYVLKRLLRMAAEEGYDSIGWTPADIQSKRWSYDYEKAYKIEYDQEMPKFLRKYGKQWGATVGKTMLDQGWVKDESGIALRKEHIAEWQNELSKATSDSERDFIREMIKREEEEIKTRQASGESVWSMDITDSMKNSVLTEGQPLYSDRDSDSVSNRSLLANALESVAQNDIERNKLKEYKNKIALIESEQAKLSEIRAKIKDLSFAKGARDTEAIKSLQFEANQAASRINTYDKQLLNLESTKALKDVLEREKEMARQRERQKGKEALIRQREKAAETQRELMTRYQESRKKNVESRHKTAMRHKIKDVVNELNQYLTKGTKDKHVPIELQKAVAEALDAVNMDTVGAEERIAKKRDEMMRAKTPEAVERLAKEIRNIEEMGGNMAKKISRLKTAYDSIINSDDPLVANSHDEVIANTIDRVIEYVGETPLRDMSLHQLEAVYDMYKMVLTSVRNANKAFKAKKSEEISVIANRVMEEVDRLGKKKLYSTQASQFVSKFDWNNLKPVYAFDRIGSNTFTEVFNNVRAGEDTWAVDITEAKEFSSAQRKQYKYDSWDFKKRYGFTSSSGMHFELSLEQIMSLYAYSKREQAKDHLKKGGIVLDETTEVTIKNKLGIPIKFNPTQATAYNLSDGVLADIISKLTPEQKSFVDAMQDYLSTTMGEKGNEVSLALYGVKLYKEKNYFPLKSATQFMAKAKEQQKGEVKVKNSGFSKETTPKANNPIVLTPFMDVWADHVNEMSMYHAFVLPLEDFYRVYNYKTPTSDTMATESVEMYLQNAYGKAATQYIDQLLKDLNGGARVDPTTGIINKLTGLFKKSAVFASASVVIQQPSAIARATALVDTKYFVGVPNGNHKSTWAEVKKYAPVAVIKEMGYFDTGMGQSTVEWIKDKNTLKDKIDDAASKAPALADEYAWCAIWNAVKRETLHTNKDLKPNSEEFLKAVGERFTEVITKTQVYDSVLSRSGNMRSKDTGMKMATAFMGEPTTSLNMLENAFTQSKRGNRGYARKAVGSVVASMILNSILVSFVYAGRDDDEDKTYAEKYISTLTEELLDSFNPLTLIPFIKDIVSIAQGYDVERSDMAIISDIVKAWNNLDNDNRSAYRKVEDFAGAIASIFGLPVKNVMRDARAMYNIINSFINGEKTTSSGVKEAVSEAVTGKEKSNGQQLYEAILNGDTEQVERVKGRFKDQKAIDSALRKALRDNDPRIKEAAVARYNGNTAEYMRIAKEIIADGNFSQDNVVAAINAEINAMDKGETASASDKEKSIVNVEDYYNALLDRDEATAYTVKEDIITVAIANGKARDEVERSFINSFTNHIKDEYKGGKLSSTEAKNMLVNYGERSESEANSKVRYWEFQKNYPQYDLTESAVTTYYEELKSSGISISAYYDYTKRKAKCEGTDSNNDGKADSGTKKAEIMAVINSLPITSAQKDALYFANGWSKSTLYEAPWH